jgi:hypothetical protein
MLPLPPTPFEPAAFRAAEVSRRSLVKVDGAQYSVWCTWAGLPVRAYVGVDDVDIVGPDGVHVIHRRQPFGGRSIDYRHYVRELARKPQALRQVADELVPALGPPFDAVWRQLVEERGPKQAARVFAQVLHALEELGERVVRDRLGAALATGEPLLLALRPPPASPPAMHVDALPPTLASLVVHAGRAADYDALLGGAR